MKVPAPVRQFLEPGVSVRSARARLREVESAPTVRPKVVALAMHGRMSICFLSQLELSGSVSGSNLDRSR